MAVACAACSGPVHEAAPKCPHCGGKTGVAVDRRAVIAATIQQANATTEKNLKPDPQPFGMGNYRSSPLGVISRVNPVVGLGVGLIGMAIDAMTTSPLHGALDDDEWAGLAPHPAEPPAVPKAVARVGVPRAPTEPGVSVVIEPVASRAPEAPLPAGDAPRFLK